MLGAAEILAPVIAAGELDVLDIPGLEAVQTTVQHQLRVPGGDDPAGLVLKNTAADMTGDLLCRVIPAIIGIAGAVHNVGHQVLEVDALLHGLGGGGRLSPEHLEELGIGVPLGTGVLVGVFLHGVEPGRQQRVGHQIPGHLLRPLIPLRGRRGVLFQHLVVEQPQLLDFGVKGRVDFFLGGQGVVDGLDFGHGGVGAVGIGDTSDDLLPLGHSRLVGFLLFLVLSHFRGGERVVLGKEPGQEVVGLVRSQLRDLPNTVDAPGALGEVPLTVGEADGAVVALDLHEAAQVHRLPDVVLGLALNLDAEPGIVPVLLLDGMEHHDDVLVQLIEAVVHEALELAADEAIALEGEGAVPLAILDVFLDGPLGHEGNELPAGIEDQRIEVLDVNGGQVLQDFVIALGLDVGLAVPGLDAVDAEVHVNVQGAGGREGQGGLADAGVAGNQHTDLLGTLLDFVGVSNHGDSSFLGSSPQLPMRL